MKTKATNALEESSTGDKLGSGRVVLANDNVMFQLIGSERRQSSRV